MCLELISFPPYRFAMSLLPYCLPTIIDLPSKIKIHKERDGSRAGGREGGRGRKERVREEREGKREKEREKERGKGR